MSYVNHVNQLLHQQPKFNEYNPYKLLAQSHTSGIVYIYVYVVLLLIINKIISKIDYEFTDKR